jgi:hypothetical protein
MKVCLCVRWFPLEADREACPFHSSRFRPKDHDYWNGSLHVWQVNRSHFGQNKCTTERETLAETGKEG